MQTGAPTVFRFRLGCDLALAVLASLLVAPPTQAGGYRAPRTPWGDPNLQGLWSNFSLTRLERPAGVAGLVASEADLPAVEAAVSASILPSDPLGARTSEWWAEAHLARIDGQARTSWIVSPADGRLPYTPEGRRRMQAGLAARLTDFEGPEARDGGERCLVPTFAAGTPPYQNAPYAANYLIVQTRAYVVLVSEIDNEVRIVRLNAPHSPAGQRYWTGDSVGHWEKDTLVVETVGFHELEAFRSPVFYISADAKVTERFTRVSPTEIRYGFTVDDPAIYTQTWRGEMPFRATKGPMYEYACHEGNYSLAGILSGARYEETHPKAAEPPAAAAR